MNTIEILCDTLEKHGPLAYEDIIGRMMVISRAAQISRRNTVQAAIRRGLAVGWIKRDGDMLSRTDRPLAENGRPFIPLARDLLRAAGGTMPREELIEALEARGVDKYKSKPNLQTMCNRGLLRRSRVGDTVMISLGRGAQTSVPFSKGGQPLDIALWIDRVGQRTEIEWKDYYRRTVNRARITGAKASMLRAQLIEIAGGITRLTDRGRELLAEVLQRARERNDPLDNDEREEIAIDPNAEAAWARLMDGERFEDHPRARTGFIVRAFNRPPTQVPSIGTMAAFSEAKV